MTRGFRHPRRGLFVLGLMLVGAGLWYGFADRLLERAERDVVWRVRYEVRTAGKPREFTLVALLPRDLEHRQRVRSLHFDPKPAELFQQGGEKYVRWRIRSPRRAFQISMRAEMTLYRNDLVSARRRLEYVGAGDRSDPATIPDRSDDPANLRESLKAEKYLEHQVKSIRDAAEMVRTRSREDGSIDDVATTRALHEWVRATMADGGYNPRDLGAAGALRKRSGDCTDYADLFVALCRSKGIPARVIEGYTTSWSDTPKHNWSEVWLRRYGWVTFDPFRAESFGQSFERLENTYIQLSRTRNNTTLRGHHFYWYDHRRAKVAVTSKFEI